MKKEMKPEDIQMTGWALIWGGIALALIIVIVVVLGASAWYPITNILTLMCLPLLAIGMWGLRSRFGDKAGGFGKNILLVGAILGPITSIIGFFLQNLGKLWTLIFIGPIILFVCLALFGLVGLYKKPLPRWNVLPIIAGLWLTIRWLPIMIPALPWSAENPLGVADVVFGILQVAALVALGLMLKSDVPEEAIAAV